MSKNILLTGGAGYIGSSVAHLLIDKGYSVTIIDNLITGSQELIPKKALFINCDISDTKTVSNIIRKSNFDLVMHFAGLIRVDESVKKPKKYKKYNFDKSVIFLNTCLRNNLNKVIFSSTASVYGNSRKKKVSEKDKLDPLNPYASSKLKLEKHLINLSKKTNLKYIILRYFNVAGAEYKMRTGLKSKFASHLIKVGCEVVLKKRKKLTINGNNYNTIDGTPVRDYIHVSDLADIHFLSAKDLIKNEKSNIFNCGYGKGFSVIQVINHFNKILKYKLPTKIGPRRPFDSSYVVADSNKFKKYFKWKPKYNNLNYIIKTAIKWEKKLNKLKI
tara:strand:- start:183 stop:1175 length:993 start_codon:yes stop_codon:yes gene_type:complete